jgi:ribosomal protein S18 acetylase RimI-like enzyme
MTNIADRPLEPSDVGTVADLLARACREPLEGIGYPRCRTAAELDGELRLFGLTIGDAFRILVGADGGTLGAYEVLWSPGQRIGFLAGPLLLAGERSETRLAGALERAERHLAPSFDGLRTSIREENAQALRALRRRGWRHATTWVEMECALATVAPSAVRADVTHATRVTHVTHVRHVTHVTPADEALLESTAALLARSHGWTFDPVAQLRQYLADGYAADVLLEERDPVACVVWRGASDGTVRIEWACTARERRRTGLGSRLLAEVQASALDSGQVAATLTVDHANKAARGLFASRGFRPTRRYLMLTKDLAGVA